MTYMMNIIKAAFAACILFGSLPFQLSGFCVTAALPHAAPRIFRFALCPLKFWSAIASFQHVRKRIPAANEFRIYENPVNIDKPQKPSVLVAIAPTLLKTYRFPLNHLAILCRSFLTKTLFLCRTLGRIHAKIPNFFSTLYLNSIAINDAKNFYGAREHVVSGNTDARGSQTATNKSQGEREYSVTHNNQKALPP